VATCCPKLKQGIEQFDLHPGRGFSGSGEAGEATVTLTPPVLAKP